MTILQTVTRCLLFYITSTSVHAADANNYFYGVGTHRGNASDPWGADPVWPLGSEQKITWYTTFSEYVVLLWQELPNGASAQYSATPLLNKTAEDREQGELKWNVTTYELNLDLDQVFYLTLGNGASDPNTLHSGYFNISRALKASGSTTSSTPKSTSSSSSENASNDDSGASSATKIGLGVGLGVGIPLLLALLAFIWFFKRRSRKNHSKTEAATDHTSDEKDSYAMKTDPQLNDLRAAELDQHGTLSELPAETVMHEAPGGHGDGLRYNG